ncbi:MAG: phosphoribosylamine--glycine ligase [Methylotenera sp.]|nr:phosphoribosylamine--glycine ligase [Oligoflexia bacterium]
MSHVLVIGSGGREHAICWKLSKSPGVSRLTAAPGNDGFSQDWQRWPFTSSEDGFKQLIMKARKEDVALVVVGPDNPLADGIVDALNAAGIPAFGPTREAAQLEASKAFAKEVMTSAGVPTARYEVAFTESQVKEFFISGEGGGGGDSPADLASWPGWVVKANGLALGKGVRICSTPEEALQAAKDLLPVSGSVLIEEKLEGEEISWMAFCDGKRAALLDPARDFKRAKDRDEGPNTGGMGAFSPVPGIPEGFAERIQTEVFDAVLQEMNKRGTPFRGVLYAGLMADFKTGRYWVLEFNVRLGDPEAQVLLPRMDADLFKWCLACANGDLGNLPARVPFTEQRAVVVIAAAAGYPGEVKTGATLHSQGFHSPEYFLAGVKRASFGLQVSGGRVFGAVGLGKNFRMARTQAYERLKAIKFEGMHYRSDIAQQAAELDVPPLGASSASLKAKSERSLA